MMFAAALVACLLLHGHALAAQGYPQRIVSLAPSLTEMLFAIGAGDRLVGVTDFCDHPEEALKVNKVGGMSNPSLEAVVSMRPDLVMMTMDGNPQEFKARLDEMGIKTYVSKARRIEQLAGGLREIGAVVGEPARAEALAVEIERAVAAYRAAPPYSGRAVFIIWPEPLIVAGAETTVGDALVLMGFENLGEAGNTNYPKFSIEETLRMMPDYIFVGLGRGHIDVRGMAARVLKLLERTPAVRNNRVFYVQDGLYRVGPRVLDGLEELRRVVREGESR